MAEAQRGAVPPGILELARHYPAEALRAAFQTASAYNTFSLSFLRGVLQHTAQPMAVPPTPVGMVREVPRLAIKRDLRTYQCLLGLPPKGVLQ